MFCSPCFFGLVWLAGLLNQAAVASRHLPGTTINFGRTTPLMRGSQVLRTALAIPVDSLQVQSP
jgi:hypothetical protein